MAPIRIVLVGLGSDTSGKTVVGLWGSSAHLRPIQLSPNYELVGICNTSKESSAKAIAIHELPSSVKAYGSPAEVAADPDVDMVTISINVLEHYAVTKPLIEGGKRVLVEWPLASNLEQVEELIAADKATSTVGLQFRADPMLKKAKQLIDEGEIGKVTSSIVTGCSSVLPSNMWFKDAEYYLDMKNGGNEFTIYFGHVLNAFQHVLGEFASLHPILKATTTSVSVIDTFTGEVVNPNHPKNIPNHILVHGELESGALASISFRKAEKPVDALALRWIITGTEGEIEITVPEDHIQMGHPDRALRLRKGKEEVQTVDWAVDDPEYLSKIQVNAKNTARMYEEIAKGGDGFATFEDSLKTHRLLDKIVKDSGYTY